MPYTPQTWADGPDGGTVIDAAALDHIEDGIADATQAAEAAVERAGDTMTGPLFLAPFAGSPSEASLPKGRTGSAAGALNLVSSPDGGEDEAGGSDYDSTARLNFYAFQRAEDGSYGEVIRFFPMEARAKSMLAWYKPADGYDANGDPIGDDWQPMAWLGAHVGSNDDPAVAHNHISIETPDVDGALQTRFEIPFGPQGSGVDQTVWGLNHVNIKTNLADFTVRADGSKGYPDGKIGIFRISGANASEKVIEWGVGNAETGWEGGIRWRALTDTTTESAGNNGSNWRLLRYDNDGTLLGTGLFLRRSDGNIALGQGQAEQARMAVVWGTADHHGIFAKPSADVANGAAYAAVMKTATGRLFDGRVDGDPIARLLMLVTGEIQMGPGNAGRDVYLARTGAATLGLTGSLTVSAGLRHLGAALGFYGAAGVAKPTVTGAKGGNTALASLMTALVNLGLVTDTTT